MYRELLMRGPSGLRRIIATFLRHEMPKVIDVIRSQDEELDVNKLPYPVRYDALDPYVSEDWPIVGAYVTGTDDWEQIDTLESGSGVFNASYDLALFVSARTAILGSSDGMPEWESPERSSAIRIRDDLTVALRSLILTHPSFGTAGETYRVVADLSSLREVYPDPIQSGQGNRFVANGVINLTVQYTEAAAVPIIGTLETVDLITGRIDDTP